MFVSGFKSKIFDKKWPAIKKAFDNFNVTKISNYDEEKINEIINTPNIIKNKGCHK
ncbi:MAG: DNA-3-methyladenine glycosylase I [Candidatus Odinarchaeota archaeon]|nr:DNA-3-methyladenine glycosylase I [Candidatus Odinarchaeota archaeon]